MMDASCNALWSKIPSTCSGNVVFGSGDRRDGHLSDGLYEEVIVVVKEMKSEC